MKNSTTVIGAVVAIVAVLLCCICVVCLVVGGGFYYLGKATPQVETQEWFLPTVEVPTLEIPTFEFPTPEVRIPEDLTPEVTQAPGEETTPTPTLQVNSGPADQAALETLKTLLNAQIPYNDPDEVAVRLKGVKDIPKVVKDPAAPYKIGQTKEFWASNNDTNENFKVTAVLRYMNEHLYFWVQNGVDYNLTELKKLADTFSQKIYQTDREFFGTEWTPGIDDDPRLFVLYAKDVGASVGGYYSSADEVSPLVHEFSNAHEMFVISTNEDLADPYTFGTMAHEFQHMIHWFGDRNEETWINEGFAELAVFLNGYDVGGADQVYLRDTDVQLNDWDATSAGENTPHYGSAFLFVTYFLDRLGEKATQAVVSDQENGLVSIDDVLNKMGAKDPTTGTQITADDLFGDWAVANYLQDSNVGDGRYAYKNYKDAGNAKATDTIKTCPGQSANKTVHQYGVDYIRFTCKGDYTLKFNGAAEVDLTPVDAHSGKLAFWSNKGDQSDISLTHAFDFTSVSGPIEMSYYTWYDLEKDFDYAYLEASTDGTTWKLLEPPSCTKADPTGANLGCGYTAKSSGWKQEKVDLSAYAGKNVQIRFEYLTDQAVNGEGMLLDDIAIPAISYTTDFEKDDGGWEAKGFVRVENRLPQTFVVSLILKGKKTTVQRLTVAADGTVSTPLKISGDVSEAILVVSGSTRFTRIPASYQYAISK